MPGPDPDGTRPAAADPTAAEPESTTPDSAAAVPDEEPTPAHPTAPVKWTGSASVPPRPEKKRRRWRDAARDEQPAPVEPPTPVDPWAHVDPLDQPYPLTLDQPYPPTLNQPYPPTLLDVGPAALDAGPAAGPPRSPVVPRPPVAPPPPPASPPLPPRQAMPSQVMPGEVMPRQAPRRPAKRPPMPPPVAGPPPGYPPPARRRRRRKWPWFLLFTFACCCGIPAYFVKPMWEQYPASASLPAQVSDLTLRDDATSQRIAKQLKADLRVNNWLAEDTFAAVYGDGDGKRVTVFGTTGFHFSPEDDLRTEMERLTDRYKIRNVEQFDTGARGEFTSCGVGKDGDATVAVCGWADHGSLATALFTRRNRADSAELLEQFREILIARG
ncbi:hypothetical protein WEI85_41240 [Actinomycetes bacterium KLBMP 9797]